MKKILTALIAALVLVAGVIAAPPAAAATAQWRSFWVDTLNPGIFNAQQVKQVVADARAANANVLIVQVVRRYECFCNNSDFPRATDSGLAAGYDPLAEVIRQGHAAGLEVHAWVNVGTMWSATAAPASPNHVFNTNGPSASGANRWMNKRSDGVERVDGAATYLDLGNPAAQDYIAAKVASIVENYNVDGINLDYIRYPDHSTGGANQWGYSATSLQRFHAATGTTETPLATDAAFSNFRRQQVTATVTKIKRAIDRTAPSTVLSVNGISYGYGPSSTRSWEATDPYRAVFQDWRGWARNGLVDVVVLMNYKRESNSTQAAQFRSWNVFLADLQEETGRLMVSGPALYLNTVAESLRQANAATALGIGWSGYSYANPSAPGYASGSTSVKGAERRALIDALVAGPFREWAAVPLMTWKPDAARDLYVIPGYHQVNGREWRTDCEAYSQTRRCTTEIKATTVTFDGRRYVKRFDWVFNNLTYLPLMTRAQWGTNPLARTGEFTSSGRPWRTECDTPATGRGGCRSYVLTYGMVHSARNADGTWRYYRANAWVFNNMVRFLDG
ncbi:family 10 glycosylhydrolase [Tessaracoccus rhinocerotis]|uniref:Family 10 glycosylhydrolase n=1 Tax=Tessaracoccus rhinocerotis TaxID=1689449 RepID=A0A553K686_9ACTN|nr:family 10 glycosylhydrolase [Tessaracoccus rhinocerotis]TRY20214.1 family 10 glycosylhydrolase [Tessaracoccus rhinocerotis]